MNEIVNKVAQSGLITIDLETYYPKDDLIVLDIKDQLWQGLALREKDFREFIKNNNWEEYRNKYVAITCSVDAIIPMWAFMLVASRLDGIAKRFVLGSVEELKRTIFSDVIQSLPVQDYSDKRIIIKGCSEKDIPSFVYVELIARIQPVAKSIMFGEPCSTVPVYKKP